MSTDNRPIGVFDSGLGGLTAVTAIINKMPNERVIYFGDTARTPYGSKSTKTIKKFTTQITDFLVEHNVKMIVIACNTVSATCLGLLQKRYPEIPILGIINPTVEYIANNIRQEARIGIIGTKVTIESRQYEIGIKNINEQCKVFSKACPLFVPIIEEGIVEEEILNNVIKYYLDDFIVKNDIEELVLGCTHYPLIKKNIKQLYRDINIINPSEIIANDAERILKTRDILAVENKTTNVFYASDLSQGFTSMINKIMPNKNALLQFMNFDQEEEL